MKIDNVHRCPYCGYMYQVVIGQNTYSSLFSDPGGRVAVHSVIYVCPHIACAKAEVALDAGLPPAPPRGRGDEEHNVRYDLRGAFFS
ncbi:MAG: hypothetical protein LBS53_11435, partial [Synergistaceae bacterium]|nr:hypothetical protein [Synergistaceae bacterium]